MANLTQDRILEPKKDERLLATMLCLQNTEIRERVSGKLLHRDTNMKQTAECETDQVMHAFARCMHASRQLLDLYTFVYVTFSI